MIAFDEFKKMLGPAADGLSDAEIEERRQAVDHIAGAMFEWWLARRNGPYPSENPMTES
jgi:hypothetical protein